MSISSLASKACAKARSAIEARMLRSMAIKMAKSVLERRVRMYKNPLSRGRWLRSARVTGLSSAGVSSLLCCDNGAKAICRAVGSVEVGLVLVLRFARLVGSPKGRGVRRRMGGSWSEDESVKEFDNSCEEEMVFVYNPLY
jgi:hypothetical protein